MNTSEQFKKLVRENRIRVLCNNKEAKINDNLKVQIEFSCGNKQQVPFFTLLPKPENYEQLLHGDTVFQTRLRCNEHCHNKLRMLKLKPFKKDEDFQQIWNIEHGRVGYADITVKIV